MKFEMLIPAYNYYSDTFGMAVPNSLPGTVDAELYAVARASLPSILGPDSVPIVVDGERVIYGSQP